jgi:hypothetical protein
MLFGFPMSLGHIPANTVPADTPSKVLSQGHCGPSCRVRLEEPAFIQRVSARGRIRRVAAER